MKKITKIDRDTCRELKPIITKALNEALAEYGLTAEINGGRFEDSNYKPKLTIIAAGADPSRENFDRVCTFYDLAPEDYGKEITIRGENYKLIDLATRSPKFPIILKRLRDGQDMKFERDVVSLIKAEGLGAKS